MPLQPLIRPELYIRRKYQYNKSYKLIYHVLVIIILNKFLVGKVEKDTICRLQPGVTVDYVVKFKPIELPNSLTYLSLKGVKLVFETASNNRPDVKNVFHIPISFCMVKPEPELVTKTIMYSFLLSLITLHYITP